jgi:hypothetical protein
VGDGVVDEKLRLSREQDQQAWKAVDGHILPVPPSLSLRRASPVFVQLHQAALVSDQKR